MTNKSNDSENRGQDKRISGAKTDPQTQSGFKPVDSKILEQDSKNKIGHFYDGIEELDYSPPYWFMLLFYSTIVWGVGYYFYYQLGPGSSLEQEYVAQVEELKQAERSAQKESAAQDLDESGYQALLKDSAVLAQGKAVYLGKCASCHGANGQGGIGPNMTDRFYLHGGAMSLMANVVKKGVLEKGMPPWEQVLSKDELHAVVAWTRQLRGNAVSDGKPPQGTEYSGE